MRTVICFVYSYNDHRTTQYVISNYHRSSGDQRLGIQSRDHRRNHGRFPGDEHRNTHLYMSSQARANIAERRHELNRRRRRVHLRHSAAVVAVGNAR